MSFHSSIFFVILSFLLAAGTFMECWALYWRRYGHTPRDGGLLGKFLLGFGLYGNTSRLMNTDVSGIKDHIACLDGKELHTI